MRVQYEPVAVDENHVLVVNGPDDGVDLDLFQMRGFQDLHAPDALRSFHFALVDHRTQSIVATSHFHEHVAGRLESPFRGSFGGPAIIPGRSLSPVEMEAYASATTDFLRNEGASTICVVMPPLSYHLHETSAWIDVLVRCGFAMASVELSFGIDVTGAFIDRIDSGNRKRLQKCIRDGFAAALLPSSEYETAYRVVAENRAKRGYRLSMSWQTFVAMSDALPDRVLCFAVLRGAEPVAAALCLRINDKALYVAHWGEVAGVEAWSPVTLLASGLFDYCVAAGISLLDLGTASVDGKPNHGLVRYKKNLGCSESLKVSLQRHFT